MRLTFVACATCMVAMLIATPRDAAAQAANAQQIQQQIDQLRQEFNQRISAIEAQLTALQGGQAPPAAQAPPAQTTVQVAQAPPTIIKIEQPNPQVVYVPSYDPTVVYGAFPEAYPPYYPYPPGYFAAGVFTFAAAAYNLVRMRNLLSPAVCFG